MTLDTETNIKKSCKDKSNLQSLFEIKFELCTTIKLRELIVHKKNRLYFWIQHSISVTNEIQQHEHLFTIRW